MGDSADLSWSEGLSLPLHRPGPVHTSPENPREREPHVSRQGGSFGGEEETGDWRGCDRGEG